MLQNENKFLNFVIGKNEGGLRFDVSSGLYIVIGVLGKLGPSVDI